jgi:hypothetical protein
MSTLREAAQQALEALEIGYAAAQAEAAQYHAAMAGYRPERHAEMDADVAKIAAAITALRDALAQKEQEPVAWRYKGMMGMPWSLSDDGYYVSCKRDNGYMVEPLYTHPPRREWQGLTEEEIDRWTPEIHPVIRAIEQALKEKNA